MSKMVELLLVLVVRRSFFLPGPSQNDDEGRLEYCAITSILRNVLPSYDLKHNMKFSSRLLLRERL